MNYTRYSVMKDMNVWFVLIFFMINLSANAQTSDSLDLVIQQKERDLKALQEKQQQYEADLEEVKLERIRTHLIKMGVPAIRPDEALIMHSAMALVYDDHHKQAKWVAHMIVPDVSAGNIGRSNDFRPDPKIQNGSAVEEDYFLKERQSDGTYKYDGFGFDRGHLAPSADFRWSAKALSESYFYSNMTPQRPGFNRVSWAELEDVFRDYIQRHPETELYMITGPVLHDDLPVIERSINKVSIPEWHFKLAVDLTNSRAIGFLMPNKLCEYPVDYYAVSIDSVEQLTGIDFYTHIPEPLQSELEKMSDPMPWITKSEDSQATPIKPSSLPPNHFNTVQAARYVGRNDEINVCGTVVSTKLSGKGNIFLNLDKSFPNQIFTVSIFADNVPNFSYSPHEYLKNQKICVRGKVYDFSGTPSMSIKNEKAISFPDDL